LKSKTRRNTLFKMPEIQPFEKVGRDLSSSQKIKREGDKCETQAHAHTTKDKNSLCAKTFCRITRGGWLVPSGALTLCLWSIFTPNKDTTLLLVPPAFVSPWHMQFLWKYAEESSPLFLSGWAPAERHESSPPPSCRSIVVTASENPLSCTQINPHV
jgi:hypothetical protein